MSSNIHLKIIHNPAEARRELARIGVDDISIPMMAPKMQHWVFKLNNVDCRAANVLKQEMLAKGGEAAVAMWSAGLTKATTDLLLMGTLKQYRLVLKKLPLQPFGLNAIAAEIEKMIDSIIKPKSRTWRCSQSELIIGERTLVMGIINVTPDSFSESGKFFDQQKAVDHGLALIEEGADIIDIGGESTRPGAEEVSATEERRRVIPVIEALRKRTTVPISIDTQKSDVAEAALEAGADIINDISALRKDPKMATLAASANVPLILMHMRGTPKTMQQNPVYKDLIAEINLFLRERIEFAEDSGIKRENLAIDPGFGFGKTPAHNLEILRRLAELKSIGLPLVIGTSRKSTIGIVLDQPVDERLEGTAATIAVGIMSGADIIRVHDVKAMVRVAKMTDAIMKGIEWQ